MSKLQQFFKRPTWLSYWEQFLYRTKQLFRPAAPSAGAGMGAIVTPHGTHFRVWAPHAQKVFVLGSFNNWSEWRNPLAPEGDGHWSGSVPSAKAGDEYKYLIHHGPGRYSRTDPYAQAVVKSATNNGLIVADQFEWEPNGYQSPPWNELIIYELHVGTFFKRTQDKVVGSFAGVMEKMPYLRDLGINALEIMPIKEFPGDYSWGYNPCQPFAITQTYGGRYAFYELVKCAHTHGIAVIVDVVYNHFGPQDLQMWQFDGWQEHGKGGIYFYNDWRSKTPWGDTRPDYGRPEVRQFLRDNVWLWFEQFHVDGLRWDATGYIRNAHGHDGDPGANIPEGWSLMQAINHEVNERLPWKIMIAEDLQSNPWLTKEAAEGGAGFDSQWDAQFVHPIRQAIITVRDEDRDLPAVAKAIAFKYNQDAFERVIYTESHDEVANGKARVPEEITPEEAGSYFAQKRSTLGAALVFTSPGIPMIFQGQEFLEDKWFDDQVSLDWGKLEKFGGIWQLYRDLIRLRRNWHNQTAGLQGQYVHVHHVNNADKVLAFHRWKDGGPGDDVVVIANFSHLVVEAYAVGFPRPGLWHIRLNSDEERYSEQFTGRVSPDLIAATPPITPAVDGMPYFGNVTLAPYAVLILSQDRPG